MKFENLLPLKFNGNDLITGMTMGHIIFNTKPYTITITALCMLQFLILVNLLHLHIYIRTYIHYIQTDKHTDIQTYKLSYTQIRSTVTIITLDTINQLLIHAMVIHPKGLRFYFCFFSISIIPFF